MLAVLLLTYVSVGHSGLCTGEALLKVGELQLVQLLRVIKVVIRHAAGYRHLKENIDIVADSSHDDVIKWKHVPRHFPFVRGIHRPPVDSLHRGQWRRALIFSLMCAWTNGRASNRDTGDFRRHRAHYGVSVMQRNVKATKVTTFDVYSGQKTAALSAIMYQKLHLRTYFWLMTAHIRVDWYQWFEDVGPNICIYHG